MPERSNPDCLKFREAWTEELCRTGGAVDVVDDHARTCPECSAMVASLGAMADVPDDVCHAQVNADIDTAVETFQRRSRGVHLIPLASVAAAVLVVVAAGLVWRVHSPSPADGPVLRAGSLAGPVALRVGGHLPRGAWTAGEDGATLSLGVVGSLRAARDTQLVLQPESSEMQLILGTVAVDIDEAAAVEFAITTPTVKVMVTGTRFAVAVDDRRTHVDVLQGSVLVLDGDREPIAVTRGLAWNRSAGLHPTRRQRASSIERVFAGGAQIGAEFETALSAVPDRRDPQPPARRQPSKKGRATAGESRFAAASECQRRQDWDCAARNYRELLVKDKTSATAGLAMVALADIEREHLDEPALAAKHYGAYLEAHPQGPLVLEALVGQAHAFRTLKMRQREIPILERIVRDHATSGPAQLARQRLEQYGSTP